MNYIRPTIIGLLALAAVGGAYRLSSGLLVAWARFKSTVARWA